MRLKSHLHIADITTDIIQEISQTKLDRFYIRLGAIMPDILPNRRKQLHSPNKVFFHYQKELARIIQKNKKIKRISFIVGLLTHYITDAFCLSHNVYVVDLIKHVQYEHLLDDFKQDYEIPDDIIMTIKSGIASLLETDLSMDEYIDRMNKAYLDVVKKDDWMANIHYDIEQAILHVSVVLSTFILELKNQEVAALA